MFEISLLQGPLLLGTISRVLGLFGVTIVLVVGLLYFVSRFSARGGEARLSASDMLTEFRELHAQGKLSDEEYRTIKTNLTQQLQQELKSSDDKG